jgi:MFS superfamily sulfate permease-like transporter
MKSLNRKSAGIYPKTMVHTVLVVTGLTVFQPTASASNTFANILSVAQDMQPRTLTEFAFACLAIAAIMVLRRKSID